MTPTLNLVDRPQIPAISKIRVVNMQVGTWFLGRMHVNGESKLYVKVFDSVVDVQHPMNTYDDHNDEFYDVRELGVQINYWML